MSESNPSPDPSERKLEPYHYEAMIRAEVEKRMAAEKEKTGTQNVVPRPYQEPPSQQSIQPAAYGFPAPGQVGPTLPQPYYPQQTRPEQQYQSGPLPSYQQQLQQQAQPYYQPQPQPQPFYQQPPAQPSINVVVQNTNVNQNRNYVRGGYGHAAHGHIGCFNICYFLLIGWALGLTWALVGLCVLPFSRPAGDMIMRQAFFLAFLA
jgi:hypothetical protein